MSSLASVSGRRILGRVRCSFLQLARERSSLACVDQDPASGMTREQDQTEASSILKKVLVANRGEIACRVLATAKKMGIPTMAVYSEADYGALHVQQADEAVCIGPAAAQSSYLRADRILKAAKKHGVGAIHPGYGFLSENAGFAKACKENGIHFVGPPAEAIASMGSKKEAKEIMSAAGVPVVPGYHGEDQDIGRLQTEADRIGYPLLVKAIMGGGGKGMKLARSSREVKEAVESAQREAEASFGDSRVLLERFIEIPRHIEVQVLADQHGQVVHLFERDCSIQRRHQKVIEEAPAPGISESFRQKIGAAAVAAARAVGYTSAGTVEFIVDTETDEFFFMEMNTRLQVEHPITELINGVDLVELQLRVAAGEPLPFKQEDLSIKGHAIEARLYAENPAKDFLPASGKLARWKTPSNAGSFSLGHSVRIDSGVQEGDEIGISYDPMIAKVIAHGENRDEAIRSLANAIGSLQVAGFPTTTTFLGNILELPAFKDAQLNTNFISDNRAAIEAMQRDLPWQVVAMAGLSRLILEQAGPHGTAGNPTGRGPWNGTSSKRLNGVPVQHTINLMYPPSGANLKMVARICDGITTLSGYDGNDEFSEELWTCSARGASLEGSKLSLELGSAKVHADILWLKGSGSEHAGRTVDIWWAKKHYQLVQPEARALSASPDAADGGVVVSPMPGKVLRVDVAEGQTVQAGDVIAVLEAMKMEHTLRATSAGVVSHLNCAAGAQVQDGHVMARIDVDAAEST